MMAQVTNIGNAPTRHLTQWRNAPMSFEMPGLKRQMEQDMQADLFWNAEVERLLAIFIEWHEKNELKEA